MVDKAISKLVESYKNGYEIDSSKIILTEVRQVFEQTTKGSIDVDVTKPLGSFMNSISELSLTLQQQFSASILNNYVTTSYGVNLDILGSDVKNIPRKQARGTYTIVIATNLTEESLTINTSENFTNSEGDIFNPSRDYTVTGLGETQLECYSAETGAVPCEKNDLTTTNSDITITNTRGALGYDTESDTDYRARLKLDTSIYDAVNLQDSLYLQLVSLNEVIWVKIYNNNTDAEDANGVPANKTEVLIYGGNETEIARVLYNNMSVTAYSTFIGDTSVTIPSEVTGQNFTMKFTRPSLVEVSITALLNVDYSEFQSVSLPNIKKSIVAYINDFLKIGDSVYLQGIESACQVDYSDSSRPEIKGVNYANVTINGNQADLQISYKELSITDDTKVIVQV